MNTYSIPTVSAVTPKWSHLNDIKLGTCSPTLPSKGIWKVFPADVKPCTLPERRLWKKAFNIPGFWVHSWNPWEEENIEKQCPRAIFFENKIKSSSKVSTKIRTPERPGLHSPHRLGSPSRGLNETWPTLPEKAPPNPRPTAPFYAVFSGDLKRHICRGIKQICFSQNGQIWPVPSGKLT